MTAKQDDTTKLVTRIILSVCGFACALSVTLWRGDSLQAAAETNRRLSRIEDKLDAVKTTQDVEHATFRTTESINSKDIAYLKALMQTQNHHD